MLRAMGWASALLLGAAACSGRTLAGGTACLRVLSRAAEGSAPARATIEPLLSVDELALDPESDALRVVELKAGGPLLIEATVELQGMPARSDAVFALTVAELAEVPRTVDLAEVVRLHRALLTEQLFFEGPGERLSRVVLPAAGTPAVALGASLHDPSGSGARARLSDVTIAPADDVTLLRTSPYAIDVAVEPGRPVTGHFALGGVSRPALALLDEGEVCIPIDVPRGGGSLALAFGLFPTGARQDGRRVELEVLLERAGERELLLSLEAAVSGRKEARWKEADAGAPLPAGAGLLVFRARGAAGCGATPLVGAPRILPQRGAPPRGLNVVLISIDTLRADRVGQEVAGVPLTPALDALAREAVVFERAWSNCCYTLPAHVSLLSGQFPSVHGVSDPSLRVSRERTRLLAEVLADRGYATGAFTGGGYVNPRFGFARGFDRYGYVDPCMSEESSRVADQIAGSPELDLDLVRAEDTGAAVEWMRAHAEVPFFLFVHTYAAHEFDPPPADLTALGYELRSPDDAGARSLLAEAEHIPQSSGAEAACARLRELYDGAVHQADAGVGRILDGVRELGLSERTLVVVTSDHGQELGEHGSVGHGQSLYEELLRVPLFIRAPGMPARRVSEPAMLVDVLPTVLARLDLGLPPGCGGRDLLGPAPSEGRPLYAEVDALVFKQALLEGDAKTILSPPGARSVLPNGPPVEGFDLALDPGEQVPRAPSAASVARLSSLREALLREGAALGAVPAHHGLNEELLRQLRALGYAEGRALERR